ncbi:hypothetical protein [Parendozoicomonas sp. Alg238-R29]|uniref:hypothetical protein n=1 Tax=Parendozoicomonas sp. Alg238-R29 TaxID=2993446 RepID=UPI00248D9A47|nr:hypothetical protein [Parendozoicomonas sp. Alg238-R29]
MAFAIAESLKSHAADKELDERQVQRAMVANNLEREEKKKKEALEEVRYYRQMAIARLDSQKVSRQGGQTVEERPAQSRLLTASPKIKANYPTPANQPPYAHRKTTSCHAGNPSPMPAKLTIKVPSSQEAKNKFNRALEALPPGLWKILDDNYKYHPDKEGALRQIAAAFQSGRMLHIACHEQHLKLPQDLLRHFIRDAREKNSFHFIGLFMRVFPEPYPYENLLVDNLRPLIALAVSAGRGDFCGWLEKSPKINEMLARRQKNTLEMDATVLRGSAGRNQVPSRVAGQALVRSVDTAGSGSAKGNPVVYILLTSNEMTMRDALQHQEDSGQQAYVLSLEKQGEAPGLVETIVLRSPKQLSIDSSTTLKLYVHWPDVHELSVQETADAIHKLLNGRGVPEDQCPQLSFNMIPYPTTNQGCPSFQDCQSFQDDLQLAMVVRRGKDLISINT